nr:mucin-2-like [Biomphalaria glabrata]
MFKTYLVLKTFVLLMSLEAGYSELMTPAEFFVHSNNIPMPQYRALICGILGENRRQIRERPQPGQAQGSDFVSLDRLVLTWRQQGRILYNPNSLSSPLTVPSHYPRASSFQEINQRKSHYPNLVSILKSVKYFLLAGLSPNQLQQLRNVFFRSIMTRDLQLIVDFIFDEKSALAFNASQIVQKFFVQDPSSSSRTLAEVDMRKVLIELITAVNGKALCPDCPVNFQFPEDLAGSVFFNLLPPGTRVQMTNAVNGMIALSMADFSPQDLFQLFDIFIQDVMKTDEALARSPMTPPLYVGDFRNLNTLVGRKRRALHKREWFQNKRLGEGRGHTDTRGVREGNIGSRGGGGKREINV